MPSVGVASAGDHIFPTLAAAFTAAQDHDVIRLTPGRHVLDATLPLSQTLTILGAGPIETQIIVLGVDPGIMHTEGTLVIRDLSLAWGGSQDEDAVLLWIASGRFYTSNVMYTSAGGSDASLGAAIMVNGEAEVDVRSCIFRDNQCGLFLGDAASVTLHDCTFQANNCGVACGETVTLTVSHSAFTEHATACIVAHGNCTLSFVANTVSGNDGDGIRCQDGATATLTRNTFTNNVLSVYGIDSCDIKADDNSFDGDGCDIFLDDRSSAVLLGNTCRSSTGTAAIYLASSCDASVAHNVCEHNQGSGICIETDGRVLISTNTISSNGAAGIYSLASSSPEIVENHLLHNEFGLMAAGHSTPAIIGNTIESNVHDGIVIAESAQAIVDHNRVHRNASNGISLMDHARARIMRNACRGNRHYGVAVHGQATATFRGNRVSHSDQYGYFLEAWGGAHVFVRDENVPPKAFAEHHLRVAQQAIAAAHDDGLVTDAQARRAADEVADRRQRVGTIATEEEMWEVVNSLRAAVSNVDEIITSYAVAHSRGLSGIDALKEARLSVLGQRFTEAIQLGMFDEEESRELAQFVMMMKDADKEGIFFGSSRREIVDAFFSSIGRKWPDFGKFAGLISDEKYLQIMEELEAWDDDENMDGDVN